MSTPPRNVLVVPDAAEEIALTPATPIDWLAAIHEAGHAVIACKLGYELKEVTIKGAYRCCEALRLPDGEPPGGISTLTQEEVENDAKYTLAGGKAELQFFNNGGLEQLSTSDREEFDKLGPGKLGSPERQEWRAKMELATEQLVIKYRSEIESVARALLVHRRLGDRAVRRLAG